MGNCRIRYIKTVDNLLGVQRTALKQGENRSARGIAQCMKGYLNRHAYLLSMIHLDNHLNIL